MAESLEPGGLQLVIKPLCLRRQRALRHLFKPQTPYPTKFGFRPSCVTPARKPEPQCKLPTPLLPVQRSIQAYQRLADSRRLNPLFSVLFFARCACTKPGVLVRARGSMLQGCSASNWKRSTNNFVLPKNIGIAHADVFDQNRLISGRLHELGLVCGQATSIKCFDSEGRFGIRSLTRVLSIVVRNAKSAKISNYLNLRPRLREFCAVAKSHGFAQTLIFGTALCYISKIGQD